MEISAVLASAQDRVVSEVVASLQRRDQAPHDASSLEQRRCDVRHLFELVLRCVHEGCTESIITPSQQIAADRFAAGADLAEVQGTFNILEEVLWHHVAGTFVGDQRVEALGLVNAVLGAGKNPLARTYVALASRAGSPLRTAAAAAAGEGGEAGAAGTPAVADGLAGAVVRTEVLGQVGVITLDDQRKRNAIGARIAGGVVTALASLQAQHARAVVLRAAAGADVWSAGHNIDELPGAAATRLATTIISKDSFAPSAASRRRSSPWCTARCGAKRWTSCSAVTWSPLMRRRRSPSPPRTSDCRTTQPGCSTSSGLPSISSKRCSSPPRPSTPRRPGNGCS